MKKTKVSLDALQPLFDNIEKLSKVQRILICVVTIALMLGAFWYVSWRPKNAEIDRLEKQYASLQKKLKKVRAQARNEAKVKAAFEQAKKDFVMVQQRLPKTNEIPNLLANISKVGEESGLDFVEFKPNSEVDKEFYAEIPFSIKVIGRYHQVGMFFDRVARLERVVNIKNVVLALAKVKKGGPKDMVDATCTAVTYKFVDEKKDAGKKPAGRPKFNRRAQKK